MSVDKLVDSTQLDADLTTVANAIRTKGGTVAGLSFPSGMAQAISNIPSGGGNLEHTSGTITLSSPSYNTPFGQLQHGMNHKPKLFILKVDNWEDFPNAPYHLGYICTEWLQTVITTSNNASKIGTGICQTDYGYSQAYSRITFDNTYAYIGMCSYNFPAGTYHWDAYYW